MSADWTTCRVVRDRKERLWTGDGRIFAASVGGGLSEEAAAAFERALGPLAPVLDADGLPVVTTVGDLTARHIGRRVRVEGREGHLERLDCGWIDGRDALILDLDSGVSWANLDLDTPAEVLP